MMEITSRRIWFIWIIILMSLGISLACVGSGVKPDDPRLQPPLSTMGLTFEDFLKQLKAVPWGGIMAPWITVPGDTIFSADPVIEVRGWAPFIENAELVIYEVEPDPTLARVISTLRSLGRTTVDETAKSWQMQVTLPERRQYLAARLERPNGRHSPFSNIIYVSRSEPEPLLITSPLPETVVTTSLTLVGTGEPTMGLVLVFNGEKTPLTTVIADDGAWIIPDIPPIVPGFDVTDPPAGCNLDQVSVMAEATGQSATISVRRIKPISLVWPFGTGDSGKGEKYSPQMDIAVVTAFHGNDWHYYTYNDTDLVLSKHEGLDIQSTKRGIPIHSVADEGKVVAVGTDDYGSNYIIVDYCGWGVQYLHIVESSSNSMVKVGDPVCAGQIIATEGDSGGVPVHLHIEARVCGSDVDRISPEDWYSKRAINLNPPISYQEFFKPQGINLYDLWGGSDYCHPDGCWIDVDWGTVVSRDPPGSTYEQACWNSERQWTAYPYHYYSTRAQYCERNPEGCPCR